MVVQTRFRPARSGLHVLLSAQQRKPSHSPCKSTTLAKARQHEGLHNHGCCSTQIPDLNVNDLAFFSSLQKDTELVAKGNVFDLSAAIVKAWEEYPLERMASVWRLLYALYKGIVEDDGGNSYSHDTGSRKAHNASAKAGDNHDRRFPAGNLESSSSSDEDE